MIRGSHRIHATAQRFESSGWCPVLATAQQPATVTDPLVSARQCRPGADMATDTLARLIEDFVLERPFAAQLGIRGLKGTDMPRSTADRLLVRVSLPSGSSRAALHSRLCNLGSRACTRSRHRWGSGWTHARPRSRAARTSRHSEQHLALREQT